MRPQCACAVRGHLTRGWKSRPSKKSPPFGRYLAGMKGDLRTRSPGRRVLGPRDRRTSSAR